MENVKIEGDEARVEINPELFSLDVIYSAAYTLLDDAYFSFDGDPEERVNVFIKAKSGEDIENISREFQNELVNYSVYVREAERNKEVREAIVERALGTTLEGEMENMKKAKDFLSPEKKENDE